MGSVVATIASATSVRTRFDEGRAQLLCKIDRRTWACTIAINPTADIVYRDQKAPAQPGQRVADCYGS
jgi:hypothetical protein